MESILDDFELTREETRLSHASRRAKKCRPESSTDAPTANLNMSPAKVVSSSGSAEDSQRIDKRPLCFPEATSPPFDETFETDSAAEDASPFGGAGPGTKGVTEDEVSDDEAAGSGSGDDEESFGSFHEFSWSAKNSEKQTPLNEHETAHKGTFLICPLILIFF